jgi:hypothetical protein
MLLVLRKRKGERGKKRPLSLFEAETKREKGQT